MKKIFILILFSYNLCYSQSNQTILKELHYQDAIIKVEIYINNPIVNYIEHKDYYWYNENAGIKSTKGATGGSLLHGKFSAFDKDGNLKLQEYYFNGVKHGTSLQWNDEGEIIDKKIYKQGLVIYWKRPEYNKDEKYIVESIGYPYFEDTLRTYNVYGILVRENITLNDSLHIKLNLIYHKYSKQLSHKFYTQGLFSKMFGEYIEYYENGGIAVKGNYINSEFGEFKEDLWTWYDELGNVSDTYNYKLYLEKYNNGNIKIIGSMIYDQESDEWLRHGKWKTFFENQNGNETLNYNWSILEEE